VFGKLSYAFSALAFGALTLLVGRQEGHRPVKTQVRCWHGYLCGARCRLAYGPTVSCSSKIQIGFTFLVPAHLGSLGKGPLDGCVCFIICVGFVAAAVSMSTGGCRASSRPVVDVSMTVEPAVL